MINNGITAPCMQFDDGFEPYGSKSNDNNIQIKAITFFPQL